MKTFLLVLLLLSPLFPENEAGLPEVLSGRSPLIQRLPVTQWASQAFALSWLMLKQQHQTSQFGLSLVLSLSCLLPSAGQIKLKFSHRCFPSCQMRLCFSVVLPEASSGAAPKALLADRPTRQVRLPRFKAKALRQRHSGLISIQEHGGEFLFHFIGKQGSSQTLSLN